MWLGDGLTVIGKKLIRRDSLDAGMAMPWEDYGGGPSLHVIPQIIMIITIAL